MLSTLILLPAAPDNATLAWGGLVRTLSSLVPGTVEGVVRDVIIVTSRREADVRRIADHAGCALVEDEDFGRAMRTAAAQARSPFLFFLRAGAHVDRAFLDEVAQTFDPTPGQNNAMALVLRQAPDGLVRRVLPDLAPVAGLIAEASVIDLTARSFDALVRRVSRKKTLTARAGMVQ